MTATASIQSTCRESSTPSSRRRPTAPAQGSASASSGTSSSRTAATSGRIPGSPAARSSTSTSRSPRPRPLLLQDLEPSERSGRDLDSEHEHPALVLLAGDEEVLSSLGVHLEQRQERCAAWLLNARADHEPLRLVLLLRQDHVFQRDHQQAVVRKLGGRWLALFQADAHPLQQLVAVVRGERRLPELGHLADLRV